jgi:hypothetical protein
MAISEGCMSIKEVLSLDELVDMIVSLDPEVMDSVNHRLQLKDERHSSLSGNGCIPHPENKRLATTVSTSKL